MNNPRSLLGTQIRGGRVAFFAFCGLAGTMSKHRNPCPVGQRY
jgi:hypothetical protein